MPMWTTEPGDDAPVKHVLDGRSSAASVEPDPARGVTIVSVGVAVAGTDEETVEQCKRRAERLLVEAQR